MPYDPGTVLVVDDDVHLSRTVCDILKLNGYDAVSAPTGTRGLEYATGHPDRVPVALVDLRLPDMDGLELVARLREVSELTQVVILTGNASLDTAVAALRENSCDYLIKPVAPEKLVATVRRGVQRWYHRSVEEDLRRDRERFQLLVEALSEVITIVAPDGLIQWQSPSAFQTLGHEPGALMGTRFVDHVRADERQAVVRSLALASSAPGDERAFEFHFRTAAGEWCLLEGVARTLHQRSDAPIVVTGRDITERRLLEDELRQSQKMESIGRLAGGVAHDFNNQLTAIISSVDLAGLERDVPDAVAEELREIRLAAERAARLTRQLLIFSRKDVAKPRRLDVNEVVRSMQSMLGRLLPANIDLVTELRADLPPVVIDMTQLEQILLNLVVNARDAMPLGRGGRIVLRTVSSENDPLHDHSDDSTTAPDGWVVLEVEDDGVGMTDDVLERIFEPFFTTKRSGTGLGLSTVYGIVKQSGGEVEVHTRPGGGTVFEVFLPSVDEAPEPVPVTEREEPPRAAPGGETILVVEDEDAVRDFAEKALRRKGYDVLAANGGAEALRIMAERGAPVALVLTDVVMPEMSGPELVRRLGVEHGGTPVIFTSGYTEDQVVNRGGTATGIHFLPKPFSPADLARKVREVLDDCEPHT